MATVHGLTEQVRYFIFIPFAILSLRVLYSIPFTHDIVRAANVLTSKNPDNL